MSGGSYNYLYSAWPEQLVAGDHNEDLRRMADRLTELGRDADAALTEDLILEIRHTRRRIEAMQRKLSAPWQIVEWLDSGDHSHDSAMEALVEHDKAGDT